ncbi:hypothetical protein BDU57DRAFT_513812 [Ampelomyces quisqualis]|uniref:Uncharacterized protein n=1 Tax=Ampelomyces quisqualis TaxID=50730 RepID=A0A6A5QSB1_AMPQU|nr:hypothetical protein BDU57DRAFT_513812 [Ampelomyces quisqualis]
MQRKTSKAVRSLYICLCPCFTKPPFHLSKRLLRNFRVQRVFFSKPPSFRVQKLRNTTRHNIQASFLHLFKRPNKRWTCASRKKKVGEFG